MRNYEIFKNTPVSKNKIEIIATPIILGNPESKTQITVITNPFCSHCKEVHLILDHILEKHKQDLQMKIIIRADLVLQSEKRKDFFRSLMGIYVEKGEEQFNKALQHWSENKNEKDWLDLYKIIPLNIESINAIYAMQNNWCLNNEFNHTPVLFISGYEYPSIFERESLPHFINELIEYNS